MTSTNKVRTWPRYAIGHGTGKSGEKPYTHVNMVSCRPKRFHRLFFIGILFKGVKGLLETVGGLLFLFVFVRP